MSSMTSSIHSAHKESKRNEGQGVFSSYVDRSQDAVLWIDLVVVKSGMPRCVTFTGNMSEELLICYPFGEMQFEP